MTIELQRQVDDRIVFDDLESLSFRVDRRAYTDDDVAAREMTKIFDRCWLYVGHESEVPAPGSYVSRDVGGRPVVMARGSDGVIRVFANSCPHRGALICSQSAGQARSFRCPYHDWTFSNQGDLVGVPLPDGYGPGFRRSDFGLARHRSDSYRGFVFATFDPEQPRTLTEYLAGATEYLDLIADQSAVGMEVIQGAQLHGARANWKLMMENSVDIYHFRALHKRYVSYIESLGTMAPRRRGGFARALGRGHGANELVPAAARPLAYWTPMFPPEVRSRMEATAARFVERFGAERAQRITGANRALMIFPNLMIIDAIGITIRKIDPVGAGQMSITSVALAPKDEDPDIRELRKSHYLTFLGPAGFATPDDIEIIESCQRGYLNRTLRYSDLSRGMAKEVPETTDELPAREFWRQWDRLMHDGDDDHEEAHHVTQRAERQGAQRR
ncbi:aromatic ring-hydroxylating oxygenase subunit alpha [Micromonospora endolithica]|uniref:aromatic ring-hydroxylating oxygenase subunit alpha n=1 Tax=Micromonospora endolithica TaxID=230091 RepID=UPI0011AD9076|nr:aromatic ring-hydroxylating dioxygenase subunit alpha [Micromonospora endolithica]TWJ23691.1 benzoate/toluate 1,2-dioxygenase alpha subunit/p-cumate 2,3-dioxygenase alpha subunit [Micromonospora endolithica]